MNLQTLVLGSGAGGGVPQWNCACMNCSNPKTRVRTQSSIAVTNDNFKHVVLVNSSPDFATQVRHNKMYLQSRSKRNSPITNVILTDSHIDHVSGLLSMREADSLKIHCTIQVQDDLWNHFNLFDTLSNYTQLEIDTIVPNEEFTINGILFLGFPIHGKAPPYSPRRNHGQIGDTIALVANNELFYAPALENLDENIIGYMDNMNTVLVDGTCWKDDDMITQNLGTKTASDMGHINMSESLQQLNDLKTPQKYFIHINNSNPVLNDTNLIEHTSVKLAYDGQIICKH